MIPPAPGGVNGKAEPPRSKLIAWMRLNLAMTIAIGTLIWGAGGMLVGVTWQIANSARDIAEIQHRLADAEKDLDSLHHDMASVDTRFNEITGRLNDRGRARDQQIGADEARIQVLESQIRFLLDPARRR